MRVLGAHALRYELRFLLEEGAPTRVHARPQFLSEAILLMSKHVRARKFVDRKVQGRLLLLFIRSWIVSLLAVGGLTVIGWFYITPGITGFVGPNSFAVTVLPVVLVAMAASLCVLPLMLWDMVQASHRFAGPLFRFRRHLRRAADGGPLVPLHFRDSDDWHDLADAYNDLIARMQSERHQLAPAAGKPDKHDLECSNATSDNAESDGHLVASAAPN